MRIYAATPTGNVAMDQTNNAVSIVHFFFTFVVGLAYPTSKVMSKEIIITNAFLKKEEKKKKKKRERERKKKELFTENPTFTITSPEQRNININFDSRYMQ